jgi:ABC-type transport system involved in multi-copper enzyme maturation permease subunit
MITHLTSFAARFLSPLRLTGPIFDKELRVSSRRRRNYVLRFAYISLLTAFLVLVWIEAMGQSGSAVYRISRMAEAGKFIVVCMVWFQFCATQILALILLSNSISDEIYHRTLGLLMTTPISSFQMVMGKLFSKLLQLVLLLAISLPLLAIIRVMGGVPWNYVVSSLCITLTTVIFVGSLSLFLSIFCRRTYVVIIITILTISLIFALLPLLTAWIWHAMDLSRIISEKIPMLDRITSEKILSTVIFSANPYCTMFLNSMMMVEPRAAAGMPAYLWSLNCGIMLALSTILLFISVIIVRKVALRQATGQIDGSAGKRRSRRAAKEGGAGRQVFAGTIRRVVGPPIIWKELRSPMFRHHKIRTFIFVSIGLILLSGTYYLCAKERLLDDEETHAAYAIIFLGVGMLFTIVLPATSITTEVESRSWPVLLATPLNDKDILLGKFVGALRRCFPAWLLLFGHIIAFSFIGFIHPLAIIQTGILVIWIVVFLSGSGLYFSSRFKHTTTAVSMNFGLVVAIWAILPLLMGLVASINTPFTREARELVEAYIDTNPFVHVGNIMIATAGDKAVKTGSYYWPGQGTLNAVDSTVLMLSCMVGYILIGVLFAWRAKCQFRRKIF